MGIYLNPDNIDFQESLNSEIYVDKSELINLTNSVVRTQQKFVCVTRPRRFGKSVTANMLTAYYSKGCASENMFSSLKISSDESFEKHLNAYNTIHINIVEFSACGSMSQMICDIEKRLLFEIVNELTE